MNKTTINNILGTLTALDKGYKDRIFVSDKGYIAGDTDVSISVGEIYAKGVQIKSKDLKSALGMVGDESKLTTAEEQVDIIDGDTTVAIKEFADFLPLIELSSNGFDYEFELDLKTFIDDYKMLKTSISKDQTRIAWGNVLLEIEQREIRFITLDGYRMNVLSYPLNTGANQMFQYILNTKMFELLSKIKSKSEKFTVKVNKNQAMFIVDDFNITGNNIDGAYPQYKNFISKDRVDKIEFSRAEVKAITDHLAKIPKNEKANLVKLTLEGNNFEITQGDVSFSSKKVLNLKNISSKDWTIAFNKDYLLDALKTYEKTGCEIDVHENTEINPMQFIYENKFTLVLPVRLG